MKPSEIYATLHTNSPYTYYPNHLPENWMPSQGVVCVYTIDDDNYDRLGDGSPAGIAIQPIQIEVIGLDQTAVSEAANTITHTFNNWQGVAVGAEHWSQWYFTGDNSTGRYYDNGDWLTIRSLDFDINWLTPIAHVERREFSDAFSDEFATKDRIWYE